MTTTKKDFEDFISKEKENYALLTKRTYKWGGIIAGVVFCYFTFISYQLKTLVLNPENLALVISSRVDASAPAFLSDTEVILKSEAPAIAAQVGEEINKIVPSVANEGQMYFKKVYNLMPALEGALDSSIDAYFHMHGDNIKAFYEAQEGEGFAEHFVDGAFEVLMDELDRELEATYDGKDLNAIKHVSLSHLNQINDQITHLSKLHTMRMTPIEKLQRRFVVAWYQAINQQFQRIENREVIAGILQ